MKNVKLLGRVLISGEILTKTGLHIGGSPGPLAIGNVDMPVIRDERTNQPYIPGSSLKGKMRSLSEKWTGAPHNRKIGKDVCIHVAETETEYQTYWVNPLFGVPGEVKYDVPAPNRLVIRDVPLAERSKEELLNTRTDMPYSEVKWEAAIDRVTSAATPRQIERVPAGTIFSPMELVFNAFGPQDVSLLSHLLTALQLLEDDYLGGQGSRGSGKIAFQELTVEIRHGDDYASVRDARFEHLPLSELLNRKDDLLSWITEALAR
jgi:CRISPR-associated protein Csm3